VARGSSCSSASRTRIQSAWIEARARLCAAAKSSFQGMEMTRAPSLDATAIVSSVEPVSASTIWSTMPLTLARQAGSKDAAFLVIMDKARVVILLPLAGFVWMEKRDRRRQFSRRATLGERFQTGDANRRAAQPAPSGARHL